MGEQYNRNHWLLKMVKEIFGLFFLMKIPRYEFRAKIFAFYLNAVTIPDPKSTNFFLSIEFAGEPECRLLDRFVKLKERVEFVNFNSLVIPFL